MKKTISFAAVALASSLLLAGCSTGGSSTSGDAAADCKPSDGKVDLTFTSWVPGIEDVVKIWNDKNPDIQVKVQTGPSGNAGTYKNFFNQLKAGNTPDIGQIEYDTLANFRVQGGLTNIANCEGVADAGKEFVDWTWDQVTFGEKDSVYAIPQDAGPLGLFYRSDLFAQNNIPVPTTWEEYTAAAEKIRALGGYITNFSDSDVNQFAGFVWQAKGSWFSNDNDKWTVDLTSDESIKVADYWQDLIDRDLVSTYPAWTTEWNNAYNSSQVWTWNSAVWGANSIKDGAPDTAGKWSVAQSPQWKSGEEVAGNWGGSTNVVFSNSKHPYEASKFMLWLNTDEEALTKLNEVADVYPASKLSATLPALSKGVEFYGGQAIFKDFAKASENVPTGFVWGPAMTQTYNSVSDGFKAALSKKGTLADALKAGQKNTIETLKSQSIPVNE